MSTIEPNDENTTKLISRTALSTDQSFSQVELNRRLIIFTLFIAMFSAIAPSILTGLLLINISETFEAPLGLVAQMGATSSGIGAIGAIFVAAVSMRFRHKSLLMIGLVLLCISALGCFFAPTLPIMFVAYSLSGLGMAMISPMANALVGDVFPVEQRSSAIGIIIAGASLGFVLGAPIISYMNEIVGWRLTFIGYVFLLNVIALVSARLWLPSRSRKLHVGSSGFIEGFRRIVNNRSAIACLIGVGVASASMQGFLYFSSSFYRSRFEIPTTWAAIILSGIALSVTLGSQLSGRIVNRYGRKRLLIMGLVVMGLATIMFTNISWFWISVAIAMLGTLFEGIRLVASNSLVLEQVPDFRGSMMSLNTAAINTGSTVGVFIGGMILLSHGWNVLGLILGVLGIVAAVIMFLFTIDPIKDKTLTY